MAFVITQPCEGVKDASCVDVCPVDCIHSDDDAPMYYINPDDCIDCAYCVAVCPYKPFSTSSPFPLISGNTSARTGSTSRKLVRLYLQRSL